jgi:hypothetical protein
MWLCDLQSLQVTQPLRQRVMAEKVMWLCDLQSLQVTQPLCRRDGGKSDVAV